MLQPRSNGVSALFERFVYVDHGKQVASEKQSDEKEDFGKRLAKARQAIEPKGSAGHEQASGMGVGYRLSIDLVAGILVGAFLGYWLDRWFETSPAFLIGLFLLGCVAGYVNMMRTLRHLDRHKDDKAEHAGDDKNRR